MKKNLFFSSLIVLNLIMGLNCFSQGLNEVLVPDPIFRTWITNNYPACLSGNYLDTICAWNSSGSNYPLGITNYGGNNYSGITDLTGLQYFKASSLVIGAGNFQTMPNLEKMFSTSFPVTQYITIENVPLTALPRVGMYATQMTITNCQISHIPHHYNANPLNKIKYLSIIDNNSSQIIDSIENFNPTVTASAYYPLLKLQNVGLTSVSQLGSIVCYAIKALDLSGNNISNTSNLNSMFLGLNSLNLSNNNLTTLTDIPGNVFNLYLNNNHITDIGFITSTSIGAIYLDNNPITCLPTLPNTLQALYNSGTGITCIPNQPQYLVPNPWVPVCTPQNIANCAFYPPIKGHVFKDLNNNGQQDTLEPAFPNLIIGTLPNSYYNNTNLSGEFQLNVDVGNYTIVPYLPNYYTQSTPANTANFTNVLQQDTDNVIGVYPTPNVDDLSIVLNASEMRPGFSFQYYANLKNEGTNAEVGTVSVTLPADVTYVSSIPAATVNGNVITWSFTNLQPLASINYKITCSIAAAVPLGTMINGSAAIVYAATDLSPANNISNNSQPVVGSFDPNDKLVFPTGNITPSAVINGQELIYTIRFQNTGTASAVKIRVVDSLSAMLDVGTFQMVGASHNYSYRIQNRRVIWEFNNINLPDSNTNEPLSHGFVQFKIMANNNLVLGDIIQNHASIYFDFNSPIYTNTTMTEVALITSVNSTSDLQNIMLYPNPTYNSIFINNLPMYSAFVVIDASGKLVLEQNLNGSKVDVSNLLKGLYFYKVYDKAGNTISQGKLIKN